MATDERPGATRLGLLGLLGTEYIRTYLRDRSDGGLGDVQVEPLLLNGPG